MCVLVKILFYANSERMQRGDLPMCINEVFERIKEIGSYENQDVMIEELDISRSFFFSIKKGERQLSDEKARKLAQMAKLPVDYVLTINNIEKCKDAESLEAYKTILKALEYIHTQN